jgi:hypothetical protein
MASSISEEELKAINIEQRKKPWKYLGYRAFASFLASDNSFLIFRHFGVLNARVLLHLQDQIVCLEERLDALDSTHSARTAPDVHNGSFRYEKVPERTQILEEIHEKLKEYSKRSFVTSTINRTSILSPETATQLRLTTKHRRSSHSIHVPSLSTQSPGMGHQKCPQLS